MVSHHHNSPKHTHSKQTGISVKTHRFMKIIHCEYLICCAKRKPTYTIIVTNFLRSSHSGARPRLFGTPSTEAGPQQGPTPPNQAPLAPAKPPAQHARQRSTTPGLKSIPNTTPPKDEDLLSPVLNTPVSDTMVCCYTPFPLISAYPGLY